MESHVESGAVCHRMQSVKSTTGGVCTIEKGGDFVARTKATARPRPRVAAKRFTVMTAPLPKLTNRSAMKATAMRSSALRSQALKSSALRATAQKATALRVSAQKATALKATAQKATALSATARRATALRTAALRATARKAVVQ